MGPKTIVLAVVIAWLQVTLGGYVPVSAPSYYPTYYPTPGFVQQQVTAPVSVVQVPQKQPLQLRPPTALPNVRPPVVAIHAQQPAQLPVVAIHAQEPPRKIVLPLPTQQIAAVPNYSYSYAVKDTVTGDEKSHEESRTGDNVVGRYTVVEPDGTLRTVTYTAGVNGFNAIVERTPGYAPPNAPVKVVTPVAVSRPVSITAPALVKPIHAAPIYPPGFHFGG